MSMFRWSKFMLFLAVFTGAAALFAGPEKRLPADTTIAFYADTEQLLKYPLVMPFIFQFEEQLQPEGLTVRDFYGRLVIGGKVTDQPNGAGHFTGVFTAKSAEKLLKFIQTQFAAEPDFKALPDGKGFSCRQDKTAFHLLLAAPDELLLTAGNDGSNIASVSLTETGNNILCRMMKQFPTASPMLLLAIDFSNFWKENGGMQTLTAEQQETVKSLSSMLLAVEIAPQNALKITGFIVCKDAAGAAQCKAEVEKQLQTLAADPQAPAALKSVKVTGSGNTYTTSLTITQEELLNAIAMAMQILSPAPAAPATPAAQAAPAATPVPAEQK